MIRCSRAVIADVRLVEVLCLSADVGIVQNSTLQ